MVSFTAEPKMHIDNKNQEKSDVESEPAAVGWNSRPVRVILCVTIVVILVLAAWRSINYISGTQPGYDSGIFTGTAVHMRAGRALYRDVWDHKQPTIFLLNLYALKFGDGTINSIRFIERIFAVAGVIGLFWMVTAAFGSQWLGFLAALFFLIHLYYPRIFEYGNRPEEYGAVLLIGGIGAAFASQRLKGWASATMALTSGLFFSLAVLFKEPFALAAFPWFLYVVWPKKGNWRRVLSHGGLFIIGTMVPVSMLFIWLLANELLSDWINAVLFNFSYALGTPGHASPSGFLGEPYLRVTKAVSFTLIAAGLGLISLLDRPFVRKHHYLPFVITASAITSFIATCLSGRHYSHYYMMLVPSYVLLATCGLAFALELLHRAGIQRGIVVFLLLGILALPDVVRLKDFADLLAKPAQRWEGDAPTQYIVEHSKPTDTLWTPTYPYTYLYLDTGLLSPTKWLFVLEHLFVTTADSTREEKLAELKGDLERNQPRFIVTSKSGWGLIEKLGLAEWLKSHYKIVLVSKTIVPVAGELQLWECSEQAAAGP